MNNTLNYIEKNSNKSFFLALLLMFSYQCINIFWGFEVLDSGQYLTFYDNIFDAPESVGGLFSTYLSGIIGGTFMKLFPTIGIVGFRLLHALFLLTSFGILYFVLKGTIPVIHMIIGFSMVVACNITSPPILYNGTFNSFFYVLTIVFLYKGILLRNNILIGLGGFMAALNIFVRLPNILDIGFIAVIFVCKYITGDCLKKTVNQILYFMIGVLAGIVAVSVLIVSLGHESLFLQTFGALVETGMGSTGTITPADTTHSFMSLLISQFKFYFGLSKTIIILVSILYFTKYYLPQNKTLRTLIQLAICIWLLPFLYLYFNPYDFLCALCFIGCIYSILKGRRELKVLACLALFMLVIEPQGSNYVYCHGPLSAVVAAPLASFYLLNRKNIVYIVPFYIVNLFIIVFITQFFDAGSLAEKRYSIDNALTRGIHVTHIKSQVMSESLNGLKSFVSPGDTMLVLYGAPMMNYLTHTRPFGGIVWFVSPSELSAKLRYTDETPKILITKFYTYNRRWYKSRERYSYTGNETYAPSSDGFMSIDDFLAKYHYYRVYENEWFVLFLPGQNQQ